MKKAIIVIIIAAAAIGVCSFGYFANESTKSTSNKVLAANATSSNQTSNLSNNNRSSNSKANNQLNNRQGNSNQASNNEVSSNNSNQKENSNNQRVVSDNTNKTISASNLTNVSSSATNTLNISSDFTNDQIQTLENIIKADNISPGAGTDSLVINLDYYSVVNGQKYYAVYGNTIPGTNWYMAGAGPFPTSQGNYSQVQFIAYENQYGKKISQAEFLNGQLSFNSSDTSSLSKQDISNMIKKTAIMYATYSGFNQSAQQFNASELTSYNKNIMINTNNTKNINGETYYEVEYKEGQPFYISLTGKIYVSQEHYLSTIFRQVPSQTNAQVKASMKGI